MGFLPAQIGGVPLTGAWQSGSPEQLEEERLQRERGTGETITEHERTGQTFSNNDEANRQLYQQLLAERAGAGKFQAPGVTTQDVAAPSPVLGAAINDAQAQEIRGQQLGYLGALRDRMEGRAPSVAAAQYDLAQGDIAKTNLGLAAQARGVDAAAARRQAILSNADQTQRAGLGQALLRAQESATAAGQLGGALEGVRGADVNTAVAQAGLNQQANLAGQALATDVAVGNANRGVGVQATNAANALGANAQNIGERQGLLGGAQTAAGQVGTSVAQREQLNLEERKRLSDYHLAQQGANKQLIGAGISGGATLGAGLIGRGK